MMNEDDVVKSIRAMLEEAEAGVTDECCIYRVPFDIRKINHDAYTPKVVSIGPFHHKGNPRLQNMEKLKRIYCNAFLKRSNTSLESWIRYIQGVEPQFHSCYSDALDFTKEELVQIILVDSGFIFELFWRTYYEENSGLSKPHLTTDVRLDLLLLENQLPFFVLDHLFNLSKLSYTSTPGPGGKKNIPLFIAFTFDYFAFYNRFGLEFHSDKIKHFTDLLRFFHLQHPPKSRTKNTVEHLPSAAELSEAGVRFKANTTRNCCLLDLKFSGGVLEIPQLKVQDWTELLFRNMVALEQCHYPHDSIVTDYVAVFDFLVNTSRDVDILVRKGVLVNWLGDSDSVADMFNGLWKNVTHIDFSSHYYNLSQDLDAFCRNPWHILNSTLRRDYCNTPWQTAVSIAGIVLLILSLVESVCSVLQVMQQCDDSSPPKTCMMNHNVKAMLEGAEPPLTKQCCIYRVPFRLRKLNEDAYTPMVVSIGPFHHNRHNMEKHKLMFCKAFLERTQTSVDGWIRYIEMVEPDFRSCYSDTLEFSKEELVNIIFVDSDFIFNSSFGDTIKNLTHWFQHLAIGCSMTYKKTCGCLRTNFLFLFLKDSSICLSPLHQSKNTTHW